MKSYLHYRAVPKRRPPARPNSTAKKLRAALQCTKQVLLKEFDNTPEHLVRLALNEAEALAWQTGVPQLVFPTLAREKAEAVATWHARQRALQEPHLVFAA